MKAEKIHSGQYRPYGDSCYVWMVEADEGADYAEVMAWCRKNLIDGSTIPESLEFFRKCRGCDDFTISDYFKGYVTLHRQEGNTWRFEKVLPFTD